MNGFRFLEGVWQDLKYAVRTMRKAPVLSVAVLVTVVLGIGGNTAMFSVIRTVLLEPLGYRDPDRLVLLTNGATPIRFDGDGFLRPIL